MNILVTGSGGQLGSEFRALSVRYPRHRFFFFDHAGLDIRDRKQVHGVMEQCRPAVVLNCAAFTSVDNAEAEPEKAYEVNRDGAAILAESAKEHGALLVHISSYYVFDGYAGVPYKETDETSPVGVYALSKFQGEELIRNSASSFLIIRTGWLYSAFGVNFVKTMLRLGRERESVKVVFDRVGSPAYAGDLAQAVMNILEKQEPGKTCAATYHLANEGVCSWYDFAVAIMRFAKLPCRVLPVDSSEFPVAGPRPCCSALNSRAIAKDYGLDVPWWQESLEKMLESC